MTSIEEGEEKVSIESILEKIGFTEIEDGYYFDFGNCKLKAIRGLNRSLKFGYNFLGNYFSQRSAGTLDFFIPIEVDSYEQGLALLSYYLRKVHFTSPPDWIDEGLNLQSYLPWRKELTEYEKIPQAEIEQDWIRLLLKKIRIHVSNSSDNDLTSFSFKDGILKVNCNNEEFAISGIGEDWLNSATVKTLSLDILPKRIPNRKVIMYIWKERLHIANRSVEILPT